MSIPEARKPLIESELHSQIGHPMRDSDIPKMEMVDEDEDPIPHQQHVKLGSSSGESPSESQQSREESPTVAQSDAEAREETQKSHGDRRAAQQSRDDHPDATDAHNAESGPPVGPIDTSSVHSIPEVVIIGPPPQVLSDPSLFPLWEDAQDGWLDSAAGQPPSASASPAYAAGYYAQLDSQAAVLGGPAIGPSSGNVVPYEDEQLKAILEYLHHHHDPHIEVEPPEIPIPPG